MSDTSEDEYWLREDPHPAERAVWHRASESSSGELDLFVTFRDSDRGARPWPTESFQSLCGKSIVVTTTDQVRSSRPVASANAIYCGECEAQQNGTRLG